MKQITILNPNQLVFGDGAYRTFIDEFLKHEEERLFIVADSSVINQIQEGTDKLKASGVEVYLDSSVNNEPDFEIFNKIVARAREFKADAVAGIGGGSVLDVAKLVAAFVESDQNIFEAVGIGNLSGRSAYLACLPTTSGTGSEVSPNAILLDRENDLKKGIVSPHLVPDSTYIDPQFTHTVPPKVTASTGLDALTHCLEAYTNVHAHPMIDIYALEGIKLISTNLKRAIDNGNDTEARAKLSLGSLYGGLCLGPVNTTAVHALSYPLGGMFHIAHGISNALLLPHVMEFNMIKAPEQFAEVGLALGAEAGSTPMETAENGVSIIKELMRNCDIPTKLSELNIPENSIEKMANGALQVTRLLKNNVREVTYEDALNIYQKAY